MIRRLAAAVALAAGSTALAGPVQDAQQAELERARAEIADEIHLAAYDLLDELVMQWVREPPFEQPTPVVLAGVTVPLGLGTGLQALMENHLATALVNQPTTQLQLVHCPACSAVVVHSGPEGTVVKRGVDDPAVLARLGDQTGRHALFVDLEAEGASLVLRARITELSPELPIVWSHTRTMAASSPSLLRQPEKLTTAAEARQAYLDTLRSRGPLAVPLRLGVRTYATPSDADQPGVAPPPFLWAQTGVELATSDTQAWTASVLVGYSFIPQAYQGIMAQARVHRLVTGRVRSLTRPDLYAFVGAAAVSVWGPATGPFSNELLTADQVITSLDEEEGPRATFGTLQVGLDLRVGQRIGLSTFLETMPDYVNSPNMGSYVFVITSWQTLGTEVTFWF